MQGRPVVARLKLLGDFFSTLLLYVRSDALSCFAPTTHTNSWREIRKKKVCTKGKRNYGKQLPALVPAHAITALRVCKAPKMHGPNCPPAPTLAPPPPPLEALSTPPPLNTRGLLQAKRVAKQRHQFTRLQTSLPKIL